jgi:hypothetical protein
MSAFRASARRAMLIASIEVRDRSHAPRAEDDS